MSEFKFHVCSEGDPSVGINGQSAEVTFHREMLSPHEVELIKGSLKSAFQDIWDDDVKVYTQHELAQEAEEEAELSASWSGM